MNKFLLMLFVETRKMLNTKTGTIEDFTAFVLFSRSIVKYVDS